MAARLEGIADPGGILVSSKVHGEVVGKLDLSFEDRGECQLKNISKPVRAYAIRAWTHSSAPMTPASRGEAPPGEDLVEQRIYLAACAAFAVASSVYSGL